MVIAHTNMYWRWQTAPGRKAGVLKTADVGFDTTDHDTTDHDTTDHDTTS